MQISWSVPKSFSRRPAGRQYYNTQLEASANYCQLDINTSIHVIAIIIIMYRDVATHFVTERRQSFYNNAHRKINNV